MEIEPKKINLTGLTILVIVFLVLYSIYVFFMFKNRPESAYASLQKQAEKQTKEEKVKLKK